ncbi:DUF4296 domain-containing protein [Flavobacterium sp.]|jgi:hypothetical protein|uniref:DUF4296 domain-containing protein n=1 Tax=Flavobacterium sp. TaxID=239 RepID=UPI0037C01923
MKKIVLFSVMLLAVIGCKETVVDVPEKLIEEEKMVDIFYDLSLLEAMLNYNPTLMSRNNINPYTYIYDKYGIDSLQFVANNKYYASDIKKYDKMYEKVKVRMEQSKADFDTLLKKQTNNPEKVKAKDSLTRRTKRQMIKD